MHPGAEGLQCRGFLAAAGGACGDEQPKVLAVQGAGLPEAAEAIDEGLPLRAVVGVAGGDAEEEGVVLGHGIGRGDWDGGVLLWCVHLLQDFGGERLLDSIVERRRDLLGTCTLGGKKRISLFQGQGGHVNNILVDIDGSACGFNALLLCGGELANVTPGRVL